jgi:hypothetical protein
MYVQSTCTASPVPFAHVQAGLVDPRLIPPVPPPGEGWYLNTYGMFDQTFTWVCAGRGVYLGWLWQRVVP